MTDLIESAKAVAERLDNPLIWSAGPEPTYALLEEAAAVIRELIAQVLNPD